MCLVTAFVLIRSTYDACFSDIRRDAEAERRHLSAVARQTGAQQSMMALLSDVHLDRPRVFEARF